MAGIKGARGSTAEQNLDTEDKQAVWLSTENLGLAEEDKLHSTQWCKPPAGSISLELGSADPVQLSPCSVNMS